MGASGTSSPPRRASPGTDGGFDGTVLVVDDVTPLIRAQKVAAWREVARRLAHEIKNPLTPIQLSAERLRRKLSDVAPPLQDLVQECTSTIIGEVESLKGLVDEFSQFARMPAPRAVPTELHAFLNDTLALYDGLFASVEFQKHYDPAVTQVRLDPEQMKRVMINLIDNAIEAMGRQGTIVIETARDVPNSLVRIVVVRYRSRDSRRRNATSCSCRTTRPKAAAAASVWRSCAASSRSTAAASTSPTTCRPAPGLSSSYLPDAVHSCR